MTSRLVVVCHLWPSLSPWTVWDLPLAQWAMFARSADEWVRQQKEA